VRYIIHLWALGYNYYRVYGKVFRPAGEREAFRSYHVLSFHAVVLLKALQSYCNLNFF